MIIDSMGAVKCLFKNAIKFNFQATSVSCVLSVFFHFVLPAMRQWLLCMKNLLKKKAFHEESKWMTSVESYHVTHLIEIIWENLEDPVS